MIVDDSKQMADNSRQMADDKMIEERPMDAPKAHEPLAQKIPVRDARGVADVLFKNSRPPKEILTPVELPELKKIEPTITPLERFWAWLNYYAQGEIVKGTKGERVASLFALASFATNWWKWVVGGIVVITILVVVFWK